MRACRHLEEKMRHQLEVLDKTIGEIYMTFDRCLDKGVKESRDSCEREMDSMLHPVCIYTYI